MPNNFEKYTDLPSSKDGLLINDIPPYESMRGAIDPVEVSEVTYRFGQLISTHAPAPFDIAGGSISKEELDVIGVIPPEFSGVIQVLISNGAEGGGKLSVSLVHMSVETGYWTEKFEYYLNELGEVRRKDFRSDLEENLDEDDDFAFGLSWEDRESNAAFGQGFGINNTLVGLAEFTAVNKIVTSTNKRRRNTQTRH